MITHADKSPENKSQSVAYSFAQNLRSGESTFRFMDNRPEAVAQRKLQEMANNSPQVSQLKTYRQKADYNNRNGNQAIQLMVRELDASGKKLTPVDRFENPGFINDYSNLLVEDTSVLVDGKPGGRQGLMQVIRGTAADGALIRTDLVDSIIGGGGWKNLGDEKLTHLIEYVRGEEGEQAIPMLNAGETAGDYIQEMEFEVEYADHISNWVTSLIPIQDATTVGQVATAASNIPLDWHGDLAYIVHERTRAVYQGQAGFAGTPFIPLFKQLITDVNTGSINRLTYVRKYGSQSSGNLGAEFTVEQPQEMHEKYDGKAVVHTHYPNAASPPNYGHTKPEEKKFQSGFGYTKVETGRLTALDDSKKTYQNL